MRHMRHMNNMMNSLFSDPFGMLGGAGPLAIGGPRHGSALMPFMPQMPSLNRLFSGKLKTIIFLIICLPASVIFNVYPSLRDTV
jgi:hypothetical protein